MSADQQASVATNAIFLIAAVALFAVRSWAVVRLAQSENGRVILSPLDLDDIEPLEDE